MLTRESHVSDPMPADGVKVQLSLSYSDGFGREIQHKIPAEPGPVVDGGPVVSPRWVGSGWTIFNNKGKPVEQFEPFFDDSHAFRFDQRVGVSSTLCYDPIERVVATLRPDHTWEKVVFDPWQQATWDANDTVLIDKPNDDPDVGGFFAGLDPSAYLPTWYAARGVRRPRGRRAVGRTEDRRTRSHPFDRPRRCSRAPLPHHRPQPVRA